MVFSQGDQEDLSLALLEGRTFQDHRGGGAAGGHCGIDGLQGGSPMERFGGSVFHHWFYRQFFKHLCGGPVSVHQVSGEPRPDGAGLPDGLVERHSEFELDSQRAE